MGYLARVCPKQIYRNLGAVKAYVFYINQTIESSELPKNNLKIILFPRELTVYYS